MLKQIFSNLFDRKNAKIGFNVEFISGNLNHNEIKNLHAGKCSLNFEKQEFIIKQDSETYSESMLNVYNFVKIQEKNKFLLEINTKTHNDFTFNFGESDLWFQAIKNYADAFQIPFVFEDKTEEEN